MGLFIMVLLSARACSKCIYPCEVSTIILILWVDKMKA